MTDTPTSTAESSTRDRLLGAAARLFYQQGVHVGVEELCRTAGVSKRSMYQLFGGKDQVIAASLERGAPFFAAAVSWCAQGPVSAKLPRPRSERRKERAQRTR